MLIFILLSQYAGKLVTAAVVYLLLPSSDAHAQVKLKIEGDNGTEDIDTDRHTTVQSIRDFVRRYLGTNRFTLSLNGRALTRNNQTLGDCLGGNTECTIAVTRNRVTFRRISYSF